jgi:hypothetical protein
MLSGLPPNAAALAFTHFIARRWSCNPKFPVEPSVLIDCSKVAPPKPKAPSLRHQPQNT